MNRLRILCVKKIIKGQILERITHIGGVNGTGEKWSITIEEAIAGIKSGIWDFYIVEQRQELSVHINTLEENKSNLMAKGLGYLHNLLEDLPECP